MNTTTRTATFHVAPVEPATTALPEVEFEDIIDCLACSAGKEKVVLPRRGFWGAAPTEPEQDVYPVNALLQAAYLAFTQHRPLVFSPDIVWLTIAQGAALHINENAESLRKWFVAHEGRKELVVETTIPYGSENHPWAEYVESFSAQLKSHMRAEAHELFVGDFSTTGPVERVAAQIALMDGMQSYFGYHLSECGIPTVTLEGTTADWLEIVRRVQWLSRIGLDWWVARLIPVLHNFVQASRGHVEEQFWLNLYQQTIPGSRGAYHGPLETFSGWIGVFFPFTREGLRNPLLASWERGVAMAEFRPSICRAPVTWHTRTRRVPLEFMAGLIAIDQNSRTLALRPRIGWVIREGWRPGRN